MLAFAVGRARSGLRPALLVAVVLCAVLVFAAVVAGSASAQASYNAGPLEPEDGSLYRGAYEVTEDGALIYDGDVEYRCRDLVRLGAPAEENAGDVTVRGATVEPLTGEAVDLCVEAGFPPEGVATGALPETGGPASPALLLALLLAPVGLTAVAGLVLRDLLRGPG